MKKQTLRLAVDIGNTRTKLALFSGRKFLLKKTTNKNPIKEIRELLTNRAVEKSIYLATGKVDEKLSDFLKHDLKAIELTHQTKIPIKNSYETPQTLGRDRLAGIIGAQANFPNKNCLVIDAGTCITYDWLTEEGEYLGGNIAPGITMRLEAMHKLTAKLPLVKKGEIDFPIGKSTETAMRNGAMWGAVEEVDGYITWGRKNFKGLKVIFTGGDAFFFGKHLKRKIFARPNIVLEGLNEILHYNISE